MTWKPVAIVLAVAAVILALIVERRWAIEDAKDGRDAWWRGEIARASAAVQAEVARKGEEVLLNDAALIAALGEESAKRKEAEARLARPAPHGSDDGKCPRIPAECLR